MKPILLQGHERSITQIKYNREGDLLFTVAKDPIVNVWYSLNGERLGTYNGHTGAVWCVDADWDTRHVLTGSADNSCRLWDCETGNIIMFSTDKQMGYFLLRQLLRPQGPQPDREQRALHEDSLQRLQNHQRRVGPARGVHHCWPRERGAQPVQCQVRGAAVKYQGAHQANQ
uniref:Serine-threonine kinase receptor-associated protein n=1 Tax=Taeniopygia guttata TaxID=59729 RepID=B5FZ21_TAEGU|nr:putative eukaryotic translation initiation factor 3 subunit 2 beta 36 kDa variant 1 [Taeniopygia guttata]